MCPSPLAAGVMARGPPVSIKTTNPERKLVFLIIVVRATKGAWPVIALPFAAEQSCVFDVTGDCADWRMRPWLFTR